MMAFQVAAAAAGHLCLWRQLSWEQSALMAPSSIWIPRPSSHDGGGGDGDDGACPLLLYDPKTRNKSYIFILTRKRL